MFREQSSVKLAVAKANINPGVAEFIFSTFKVIETKQIHMIASAFAFSRETLIPEMFLEILNQVEI